MKKTPTSLAIPGTLLGLFLAFIVISPLADAANEPWIDRPYQQWDETDIQRVLADSPWARKVTVTRTWGQSKAEDLPGSPLNGGRRPMGTATGESNDPIAPNGVTFGIFWMSSRVTRAATARRAVLQARMSDANAEKYVHEPQPEYEIVVQGGDMTPFLQNNEKFFQANAFLQSRKTKQKVSPSHIRYERSPDGKAIYAAVFYFSKVTASGQPLIASDEKSVEFNCKIEGSSVRVNFEPQKMVDNQGPAL